MASVELRSIGKSFGGVPVLSGIDLDVADGEFLTEPAPAGTLRFPEGVAEVSMVPPHPELAPALVPASWTGLVEVP